MVRGGVRARVVEGGGFAPPLPSTVFHRAAPPPGAAPSRDGDTCVGVTRTTCKLSQGKDQTHNTTDQILNLALLVC